MKVLDLFCGAGGASMGYHRVGFDVVGVDINPQRHYPFDFILMDALDVNDNIIKEFDLIHASPPCQQFTQYRFFDYENIGANAPNLIPQTRELLRKSGKWFVIENVMGAPLIDPVLLCGSSFGLDVRRHRLFESNFPIEYLDCDHSWQTPRFPQGKERFFKRKTVEVGSGRTPMSIQRKAMDIYWMPRRALSQAIPPAYTSHIGKSLIEHVRGRR